jgi:hypothetical protein
MGASRYFEMERLRSVVRMARVMRYLAEGMLDSVYRKVSGVDLGRLERRVRISGWMAAPRAVMLALVGLMIEAR